MSIAKEKYLLLKENLSRFERAAVAFSGGVDSTFLLKVAHDVLGDNVIAITASSLVVPKRELSFTDEFTKNNGIKHLKFIFDELSVAEFTQNSQDRCYYCKKGILGKMFSVIEGENIKIILDGSNIDDDNDFRPGARAIKELGIISPLKEVGLTKAEIRELSKELHLPTWDKPSNACYASRFPYGETINREKLERVSAAEDYLMDLGMKQVRVRSHNDIARIEILSSDFEYFSNEDFRISIYSKLKELGFLYVTLDLLGYRTGSMNEAITFSLV